MNATIERVLRESRTWAVVGCSPDPWRTSHRIARVLQEAGYRVIPVNPAAQEILGERCFASLAEIGEPVDVVDVFRRTELAGAHVDEAVAIGARAVWCQLDVYAGEAGDRARAAGLDVIENACPAIELPQLPRA